MSSDTRATSQLSSLLPLDEASLQQILNYASTLSNDAAAEHFKNLLGDSPEALDFISSYNERRGIPPTGSAPPQAAIKGRKTPKKKAPLNQLPPPRQVDNHGATAGAYRKQDEEDYMAGNRKQQSEASLAKTSGLSSQPDARQLPKTTRPLSSTSSKPPPSAAGPLISDLPNVRSSSRTPSRTSSPVPKAKVNIQGGANMHGASTTLQDLVKRPQESIVAVD